MTSTLLPMRQKRGSLGEYGADHKFMQVRVPLDLLAAAKARAADEGMTLSAWVVALMRRELD